MTAGEVDELSRLTPWRDLKGQNARKQMCKMFQCFRKVACQKGHGNPEMLVKRALEFDEVHQNASGALIFWKYPGKNC